MWSDRRFLSILTLLPTLSSAFYLPGVAPTSYEPGHPVPLHVNRLTPSVTEHDEQLHSVISFDYYQPEFNFCVPENGAKDVRESLGSIIFGDRIRTSPFDLKLKNNETCRSVCGEVTFDSNSANYVNRKIFQGYNINWLIDGLPAAQVSLDPASGEQFYSPGFPLGRVNENGQAVLNNHYEFIIDVHRVPAIEGKNKYRVVGVVVNPYSQAAGPVRDDGRADCSSDTPVILNEEDGAETKVQWTYSVTWRESKTAWATRWDKYLHVYDPSVHWYSLIYSSVFVVLLIALVSTILMRALKKDIARYNRLHMINLDDLNDTSAAVEDGIQEDSGWKLVHGDVFRCPKHPLLLSIFVGNGAQLFMMTGATVGMYIYYFP